MLYDAIPPSVVLFLDQSDGSSFPFYHLMKQSTASSAFLSSVAYLYWAHHFFQLFPWSTASSWPSIMGLISNICVPILKCFTYHLTLLLPMQCLHIHVEIMYEYLVWGFPLSQEILLKHIAKTCPCQSFFHAVAWPKTGAGNAVFILVWDGRWNYVIIYHTMQHCLAFAYNSTMLMTLGTTIIFYYIYLYTLTK